MLVTLISTAAAALLAIAILWVIGGQRINAAISDNDVEYTKVKEFHQTLVAYANSRGQDTSAFSNLAMQATAVESALGRDNYVSGVRIGSYMLQTAPAVQLAIHEMRSKFGTYLYDDDAAKTADTLQTILFRHLGRRQQIGKALSDELNNFWVRVSIGWSIVSWELSPCVTLETGLYNMYENESPHPSPVS